MFDRFRSRKPFRYSRWDGSQRLDDLDAESILDTLSDDYMRHGDLRRALERLMREGFTDRDGQRRMGLQDLMERLKQMRQQRQQRYNLDGVMDDIKQRLEEIKQLEREGIQRRLRQPAWPARSATGPAVRPAAGRRSQVSGQRQQGHGQQGRVRAQQGSRDRPAASGQSGQQREQRTVRAVRSAGAGSRSFPKGMDPEALKRVLENMAKKKFDFLDQLPPEPAGQIEQLERLRLHGRRGA